MTLQAQLIIIHLLKVYKMASLAMEDFQANLYHTFQDKVREEQSSHSTQYPEAKSSS